MKLNKKGVSGVIVTVLLILIVIASIAILATVVIPFIQNALGNTQGLTECLETGLIIKSATAGSSSVIIERTRGDSTIEEIKIFINREGQTLTTQTTSGNLGFGETKLINLPTNPSSSPQEPYTLLIEDEVKVSATIAGNNCGELDSKIVQ
jgi:predicted PurR-regulated permease PerM